MQRNSIQTRSRLHRDAPFSQTERHRSSVRRRERRLIDRAGCLIERRQRRVCSTSQESGAGISGENHPWREWVNYEAPYSEGACPPSAVRRIIGMGIWMTRGMLAPPFEFCVSEIEGLWRQILEDRPYRSNPYHAYPFYFLTGGFSLKRFDKRFKMIDSMDRDGSKGERYTRESDNPETTDAEYPRMILENRMYKSQKFKKLHVGVGIRQDGVQFVHCQMIPRPEYDMPIFTVNVVGLQCISLAYVDLFPVSADRSLPDLYYEGMCLLQEDTITSNRPNPRWVMEMASPLMISVSPKNDIDALKFLAYAGLLCKVYMKSADIMRSVTSAKRIKEIKEAHAMFLTKSLEHEQLQVAMGKPFGNDWTREYLRDCFFPVEND